MTVVYSGIGPDGAVFRRQVLAPAVPAVAERVTIEHGHAGTCHYVVTSREWAILREAAETVCYVTLELTGTAT